MTHWRLSSVPLGICHECGTECDDADIFCAACALAKCDRDRIELHAVVLWRERCLRTRAWLGDEIRRLRLAVILEGVTLFGENGTRVPDRFRRFRSWHSPRLERARAAFDHEAMPLRDDRAGVVGYDGADREFVELRASLAETARRWGWTFTPPSKAVLDAREARQEANRIKQERREAECAEAARQWELDAPKRARREVIARELKLLNRRLDRALEMAS